MGVQAEEDADTLMAKRLLSVCKDLQKKGIQLDDVALKALRVSPKPEALDALYSVLEECIEDSETASERITEILGEPPESEAADEADDEEFDLNDEDMAALDAAEVEMADLDDEDKAALDAAEQEMAALDDEAAPPGAKRAKLDPEKGKPSKGGKGKASTLAAPRMRILKGGVGAGENPDEDLDSGKGKGKKGKKGKKGGDGKKGKNGKNDKGKPEDPDQGKFSTKAEVHTELEKIIVSLSERDIELSTEIVTALRTLPTQASVAVLQDFSDRADTLEDYEVYLRDSVDRARISKSTDTERIGPALFRLRFLQAVKEEEDRKAGKKAKGKKGKDGKGKDGKGKDGKGKDDKGGKGKGSDDVGKNNVVEGKGKGPGPG